MDTEFTRLRNQEKFEKEFPSDYANRGTFGADYDGVCNKLKVKAWIGRAEIESNKQAQIDVLEELREIWMNTGDLDKLYLALKQKIGELNDSN